MTALDIADLAAGFGRTEVVHGISLRIEAGECVALVGESGSGKSVAARALLGLTQRDGWVRARRLDIDGHDARAWSQRRWRRIRGGTVGYVTQHALGSLDPLRRIGQEVRETLQVHRRVPRTDLDDAAEQLLERVGVPDAAQRLRQYPHELSGGLRQRALIATVLAAAPRFLVADEPTTALDPSVQRRIIALLSEIRDAGTGLLLISHDLATVAEIADRVALMRDGRIVEHGPTAEVLTRPRHEYTRTLLAAVPSAHTRGTRLSAAEFDLATQLPARQVSAATGALVRVREARRTFRRPDASVTAALDGVDLSVGPGRIVGVVGESGCGKTTLARVLLGLEALDSGSVSVAPGADVQAIFQDALGSFDPRFTVRRVLDEAIEAGGVRRGERTAQARRLLAAVGLPDSVLPRRPLELSGGQQQRVAIARALAPGPDLIVCDEPVSALDVSVQAQILDLLLQVREKLGVALVFISHDLGVVRHLSDEVIVMCAGKIVESGPTEELFTHPTAPYTRELLAAVPALPIPTLTEHR
ncbi:ATP-binding cassette domain-containing protein [Nocardia sp. NPDC052566]|uniref:ATP-binding cassette domain-containing protein n=1 Tax=Nocardia sp. NPDC052566 TaxID=3364330 RepID=UPI0037C8B22C